MNRFLASLKRKIHRTHPTKIWLIPTFIMSFVFLFMALYMFSWIDSQREAITAFWWSLSFTTGIFSAAAAIILFIGSIVMLIAYLDTTSPWYRSDCPWMLSEADYVRQYETPEGTT